ncbi:MULTISPECIES: hypothetical protein [unclassified Mesorhizobium]|uniref:hypothetical protein n=2 Tax=Mesorhizobium TaxID=68287 RepID=UPI00112A60E2|nr:MULTISPECIES: hypothetical protein [unclassified Mesorhizobium]MBZ9998520.1 hypothetical protein [Mesorhizobium sp. B264B2A]MCA0005065.1 hypothetical protein [Mesorhizobium sp. B264B1B]MCA0019755.1 hypothetical protein [Mesorhizobium sp. B264B1A]TPJ45673.1 hypothetical protein FJ437_15695 [Mesorhizobium sp. B2-6-6]
MPPEPLLDSDQAEEFVLKTDQAPEFWQFLNGLRGDDLLVELIVNELDARSSRTEIRFQTDQLVCLGNGDPIDAAGWERLSYIKGAGHEVAAKVGMFGVKNHGLKACFTLGNRITLRSDGQQILQTLFKDGDNKPPYPGVRVPPRDDPGAPARGTQIEVPYRRRRFSVPHGEAIEFAAVTDPQIEQVFNQAVATLPKRLLGVMRPGMLERYEVVLSHHKLGSHTFVFRAGRLRRESGLVTYFRECSEILADSERLLEREQACLTLSTGRSPGKARFFQSTEYRSAGKRLFPRSGLVIEVAWDVDAAGKLRLGTGRLRYPVAYPGDETASASGTAVHYSGAFVSDTERHELAAQSGTWNDAIILGSDALFADVLAKLLIPRHGAKALELLGTLSGERLLSFANRLLAARAFPAIDAQGKPVRHKKGSLLAVPVYKGRLGEWSAALAKAAPASLPILDPKTPAALVQLLAAGSCAGWGNDHLRYDGQDVLDRLAASDAEHFPWRSEAERLRSLGDPTFAKAHLDALHPFLSGFAVAVRPSGATAYLPDGEGIVHPLTRLKRGASIPSTLQLDVPPTIHPNLRGHPVFKLEGWHLESYVLRNLLRDGDLADKSAAVRKRFFNWLAANPDELARDDWPAVKNLPIWPAVDGTVRAFDDLCLPEAKVTRLFGDHIARPTREVRLLCKKLKGSSARLTLRDEPSSAEVMAFYSDRLAAFPTNRPLEAGERSAFHEFESALAVLVSSKRRAGVLRSVRVSAVGLSLAGEVKPVKVLVRDSGETARLVLQPKDVLDRPTLDLDAVIPPARSPNAQMVLDALRNDPGNERALLPRLAVITEADDPEIVSDVSQIPCLPFGNGLVAPDRLAFKGNLGELWGGWKLQISGEGLADNVQELYRRAGVIRGIPTPETSRAYFEWLNAQPQETQTAQIGCIMRHLHHPKGVDTWLTRPPELGCIPVEDNGGVELLTVTIARRVAVVDDLPELAEAIRGDTLNPKLRLAIHSVPNVRNPIADELRHWQIPVLSSLATEPVNPAGRDQELASESYLKTVYAMAGANAGKLFRKQLQEFDVSQSLIEPQFQRRLLAIKRVVIASGLTVQFKVRGRQYRAAREWVVLPNEIWLDRDGDLDDLLMKAIADIVFLTPRLRWLSSVLKDALRHRTRDFRATQESDSDEQDGYDEKSAEEKAGESSRPHPGSEPDPNRNNPNPGELYSGGGIRNTSRSNGSNRQPVVAEDIQRVQLKTDHYASHCQIELARRSPEELAPVGSYAQHAENRIRMLEGHHPDKTSASGARHAGNLLILSKVNHDGIGTRLSRADVTKALRDRWTPHRIAQSDGSTWLDGGIARAVDRVSGETIPIFFTNWHRDYWLKMAPT